MQRRGHSPLCVLWRCGGRERRSIAQELANISKKKVKAATGYFNINADGSYCVGSDIGLSDGTMIVVEPKEDK